MSELLSSGVFVSGAPGSLFYVLGCVGAPELEAGELLLLQAAKDNVMISATITTVTFFMCILLFLLVLGRIHCKRVMPFFLSDSSFGPPFS